MQARRWQVAATGGAVLLAIGGTAGWTQARLGGQLLPHAYCISGSGQLLWLHLLADSSIALAYLVIPVVLWRVARRRPDLPFGWVGLLFAAFIVSCGITHALEVWTLWDPVYWYAGVFKAVTAVTWLATAAVLVRLLPLMLHVPSAAQLRQANQALQHEVQQRRQAETELRAAQAELQSVLGRTTRQAEETSAVLDRFFDAAPLGLVVLDTGMRYVRINRRLAEMNGLPPKDHVGRGLLEVASRLQGTVEEAVRGVITDGRPREDLELTHAGADGRPVHRRISYFPIERPGASLLVGGMVQDITWQREMERQREEALAAAEEANRTKDRFLAQVSHELRSPLQVAVSSAEVLRRVPGLPDAAQRLVDRLMHSARLQSRLISDLLDVSRILSGKLHMAPQVLDPAQPLLAGLDHWRAQAASRHITLDTQGVQTGQVLVDVDPARLEQVYANLLDNAVRFSPDGGCIRLCGRVLADGGWQLQVRDQGVGLEPQEAARIFEPFAQGDVRARGHKGLGLGLAIVRHLVQTFGGSIRAESAGRGQGATFTIVLPAATHAALARPVPGPAPEHRLDGVRLLLVEDDADAAEGLADGLRACGARVDVAHDHAQALQAVQQVAPDLLVTDLDLGPGPGGVELVQALRSAGSTLPAIAVSAFGMDADRARTAATGFAAHLVKPAVAQAVARAAQLVLRGQGALPPSPPGKGVG